MSPDCPIPATPKILCADVSKVVVSILQHLSSSVELEQEHEWSYTFF